MQLRRDEARRDTIPLFEDMVADDPFEGDLLASLFALDEKAESLRQRAKRLNDISGSVSARTTRAARHALSAVPEGVAFHQRLDLALVATLNYSHYFSRIVVVELGRRAHAGADAAVHARLQTFTEPDILHEHIEVFSHTAKVRAGRDICSGINTYLRFIYGASRQQTRTSRGFRTRCGANDGDRSSGISYLLCSWHGSL